MFGLSKLQVNSATHPLPAMSEVIPKVIGVVPDIPRTKVLLIVMFVAFVSNKTLE